MYLLKIGNLKLLDDDLKEFTSEYQKIDGDGTKRNLQGNMRRQVVADKVKWSFTTVAPYPADKMSALLKEVTKDTNTIECFDPLSNSIVTKKVYCNAPSPEIYARIDGKITYKEMSVNIIEL